MVTNVNLYKQVIKKTENYLGPASERFVNRQIRTHLHKDPENLTRSDIKKLSKWLKLAMAMLTEDTKLVENYSKNLDRLSDNKIPGSKNR